MLPEVGVPELLVIAAIALIVVGPKDLPILMRKIGRFVAHLRGMAAEFRASFDELARQSELEELRREVEAMRQAAQQPASAAADAVGLSQIKSEIETHLSSEAEPLPPSPGPPSPGPHAVGPLGESVSAEPAEPAPEAHP
jgi:sec-independent protein translocase protein TatB